MRSPERDIVCISLVGGQVGKQVQRARDEHARPKAPRAGERVLRRSAAVSTRRKPRPAASSQRRQPRAPARSWSGSPRARLLRARALRSIPSASLSLEDRSDDDVAAGLGQPLEQPVDRLRRVGAVPISCPRASSRPGSAASTSASTGRPRKASAASRAPPTRTARPATSGANSTSGRTTVASGTATASFSARDRFACLAEHRRCARARRSSAARPRASITLVASWRPPRPASIAADSTFGARRSRRRRRR